MPPETGIGDVGDVGDAEVSAAAFPATSFAVLLTGGRTCDWPPQKPPPSSSRSGRPNSVHGTERPRVVTAPLVRSSR